MPPRPKTKRARLPAFSTGQDGAEKLADWHLRQSQSGLWSGRPTRPCSPPSSACPSRSQNSAAPATRYDRDPASCAPLRSGCVMKDASDSQPQELLSIVPHKPHRHPLCRTPGAGGTKDNSVLWPETLSAPGTNHCLRPAALTLRPRRPPQCSRQSLRHPSRQPLTPLV